MSSLTKVEYLYRDGSNYKFWGCFSVLGELRREDIKDYLFQGEYFVPSEVGLPHLCNLPLSDDDHQLHTLESFSPSEEGPALCDASKLVSWFKAANQKRWFSSLT